VAHVQADRVKETTLTTGTGTYSLGGTTAGFETFLQGIGDGNTCWYAVTNGVDWEVGLGTIDDPTAGPTLARTIVLQSSNGDAAVNWVAGSKDIFTTIPGRPDAGVIRLGTGAVRVRRNEKGFGQYFCEQWGSTVPTFNNTNMSEDGMFQQGGIVEVDDTSSLNFATSGMAFNQSTSAVSGNVAYVAQLGQMSIVSHNPIAMFKFKLGSIADVRFFAGLTSAPNATTNVDSDDPSHFMAGLQFSTPRVDSNFQFLIDDNVTPTVSDTGIAADTAVHYLVVDVESTTRITLRLLDKDGVVEAEQTFTINLPAAGSQLGCFIGQGTQTTTVKTLDVFWFKLGLRPD